MSKARFVGGILAVPLSICMMCSPCGAETAKGGENVAAAAQKATIKDEDPDWTLYACIGGGVLVFGAVVGLLAGGKKK